MLASSPALASTSQISILEDDHHLFSDPAGTFQQLHALGVTVLRVDIKWQLVAPSPHSHKRPKHFNATDPAAYPRNKWFTFDAIDKLARQYGIQVDLDVNGGAPLWATGPGAPKGQQHPNWEPSPKEFGSFVQAVGHRYDGSYTPPGGSSPLPAIKFWSVWNEPDLGFELAPQGTGPGQQIENSPRMYRNLLDAAWSSLRRTGHGSDRLLIGETAPRGAPQWGVFNAMSPLIFLRGLYCLDSRYSPLRGNAARQDACPTTAAGTRHFASQHPALFHATGWGQHMWMHISPPNREPHPDPNWASMAEVGNLERALDRVMHAYSSGRQVPVYDTEFGYTTHPPSLPEYPSQATASFWLNWAEYMNWHDPRIASFDQYLLQDGPTTRRNRGEFDSGLITYRGARKATYDAWRLPLYLPNPHASTGGSVEVWGCVRPAPYAQADTGRPQVVNIQFKPASGGSFITIDQVAITNPEGYFDTRVSFPVSGTVRLAYRYPTNDPLLPAGVTVYSRPVNIDVR